MARQESKPAREKIRLIRKEPVASFKYPPNVVPRNCPTPWIRVISP